MKTMDFASWQGAAVANLGSNSRSYCEDEQRRQGAKDTFSCFGIWEADR
jgi:hypothetical protein